MSTLSQLLHVGRPALALAATVALTTVAAPAHADVPSGNVVIREDDVRFEFEPNPETTGVTCVHALINAASQDWRVKCGTGSDVKIFDVHLWLTVYANQATPKKRYELLYWVSGQDGLRGEQTTWFHMAEPSVLHSIETRQSLSAVSSLRMELNVR